MPTTLRCVLLISSSALSRPILLFSIVWALCIRVYSRHQQSFENRVQVGIRHGRCQLHQSQYVAFIGSVVTMLIATAPYSASAMDMPFGGYKQ